MLPRIYTESLFHNVLLVFGTFFQSTILVLEARQETPALKEANEHQNPAFRTQLPRPATDAKGLDSEENEVEKPVDATVITPIVLDQFSQLLLVVTLDRLESNLQNEISEVGSNVSFRLEEELGELLVHFLNCEMGEGACFGSQVKSPVVLRIGGHNFKSSVRELDVTARQAVPGETVLIATVQSLEITG